MKMRIARAGAILALLSLSLGVAKAGPPKAPPECPVCHMKLSAKKTKDAPVAMKLTPKSKTMYCCDKCKMDDSMLVKPKTKKMATTTGK